MRQANLRTLKNIYHRSASHSTARTLATTVSVDPVNRVESPSAGEPKPQQPNREIRESYSKLPYRPKRLDYKLISPSQEADDILTRSLEKGRSPIGSSYAKAQSPVYFPNLSIRLVRPSSTDRGDPFTAIFRCDLQLTKPDIFNYLRQIYGLGITSIRTAIYRGRYERQIKSKVRGGVKIGRDKRRTFKKVWVGLDRPFFYPPQPNQKFLNENYNYQDFLNAYNRSRLSQLKNAKLDRNQVMPAGVHDRKGERVNVLRQILDSKKSIQKELREHVKQSLIDSTTAPATTTKE
ncbi:hypothetical protein PCANC_18274 [Puccinia coronata f. sp. avenae]|uniref:Large ribosomal subunit protein uL23m n=1 Tax=Puccinia coronata f. sp. avenae TaxID=200324 RepID=A0A2N5TPM7_9BASI|nr:hypothetical protein PCASD_24202 [Puccinia coronata f. sp. avenae]PLW36638.1 hypothetical protein PCANC_18274 [Puccinia coronata f. sp. avenae]